MTGDPTAGEQTAGAAPERTPTSPAIRGVIERGGRIGRYLVLRVQGANGSVLLTGDIERPQEAALLARAADRLHADVLLVPHHGSRTSSGDDFIDAVAPRLAVVQAGYRSRFGHPAPDVVQRYLDRGVWLERSDRCGAWAWRTTDDAAAPGAGAGPSGVCERQVARRYWHHRPQPGSTRKP